MRFLLIHSSALAYHLSQFVSVIPSNQSWRSQGKVFALLWREDVVPVQIGNGPNDRNGQKGDKARPVVDYLDKGQHYRNPPDDIVGNINEPAGKALLDWNVVSRFLPKPREPRGCMLLDNNSVKHPENHEPDECRLIRQNRSGKNEDKIGQKDKAPCQCEYIVPTYGQESFLCHRLHPFWQWPSKW
jgi:hypothetical protein